MGVKGIGLGVGLILASTCAQANPEGPQVVHGTASFVQPNAHTLNVTNSHNAVINWQGFSIGPGQTTNFIQPGSNSAVLNRVIGNNPSQILGNLNSNGKVFLINQHGLMIGAGARISTAGFYGSTLNITNEDFLNGKLRFEGGGLGGIQNHGYIHAGPNGNVVLIAPDIENGGVIEVDNGNVILAAGESITITSLNDASIEFDVQSPDNGIINLGSIIANQGAARLFAGNLTHSGDINATGIVKNADGSISLVAQQDIEVTATATLNADGDEGGHILVQSHHGDVYFEGEASAQGEIGSGGRIEILGDRVGLFGEATVDASGRTGGGEVLIGGDFQGQGDTQTATQTQVNEDASIHADAKDTGDGGKVIVWADDFTLFQGEATAKGGAESGDGGFIEISGKGNLGYYGKVDTTAANGNAGTVLFDPIDVTFDIASANLTLPANPLTFLTNPGQILDFSPLAITSITDLGNNVIIQADRDIFVNSAIITAEGGAGGDITFQAGQSIIINANIFTDNGTLSLTANDPGADFTNRGGGVAAITMAPGITIDASDFVSGGNIEISMGLGNGNGSGGDITLANLEADHIALRVKPSNPGSDILQNAGDTIIAFSVFIDHEFSSGGTVGTAGSPLNMVVDNVGAHIHAATTGGIYIDAQGNSGTSVTVGNTCYGTGIVAGCDTFGPHLITGLETVDGGGEIAFNVIGDMIIADDVQTGDTLATGNPGPIALSATGLMSSNNNIFNNTTDPTVILNSVNPISLTGGTYRGLFQTQAGGIPEVGGAVVFDQVALDTDATILGGASVTIIDTLDILSGRTLTLASSGPTATLTTASPTISLTGPGNLVFGGIAPNNLLAVGANTNFDIAANLTISGQGTIDATPLTATLTNNGVILSDGAGLTLDAAAWFNNGSVIAANNSTLTLASPAVRNMGGILQVDQGSTITTGGQNLSILGILQGGGLVDVGAGTVDNQGTVSPGVGIDDIAILSINGNLTQGSTGSLNFELDGTTPGFGPGNHDQLTVSGNVTFDGALNVVLASGYTPLALDGFTIMTYASRGGIIPLFESLPPGFDPATYNATTLDLLFNPVGGVFWDGGGGDTNWNNALNWNFDLIPTSADAVTIGAFVVNIGAVGGAVDTLSLTAGGLLNVNAGTLAISDSIVISGGLSIAAGATVNVANGLPLQDIVVNPGGALTNNGGSLTNLGNSLFNGGFTQNFASANTTLTGLATFNGPFNLNNGNLQVPGGVNLANLNNNWSGGAIIGGGSTMQLSGLPGTTKLSLFGSGIKRLDNITLDTNANSVDVFGSGDLDLVNGAVVLNQGGGLSFHHFGEGDITSTDASGLFDNDSSLFTNFGGTTVVSVDFTNNAQVLTLGGILSFTGNFINNDTVNVAGGILQVADAEANDIGIYNVSSGALVFSANRVLNGSLASSGIVLVDNGATLTLPASLTNLGALELDNASLDLSGLPGSTLQMDASILGGTGSVLGNVVNNSGLLVVGGTGAIGNLTISGNYTQNPASAMVVEVFNNGFSTISDQLIVTGATQLNGGTLVIGFTTTSLGLVTSSFRPFIFSGGLSGSFGQVIDAGGNILLIDVSGGIFTILGASPTIPEEILADLVEYLEQQLALAQTIASNRARAEKIAEQIREQEEGEEEGALVCKIAL